MRFRPPTVTSAVTGPSEMSSYQPSLLPKSDSAVRGTVKESDFPLPPSTTSLPAASVSSSPRYTAIPLIRPVSNALPDWSGPEIDRAGGVIFSLLRSAVLALRRAIRASPSGIALASSMSSASANLYQDAFLFARRTVQVTVALSCPCSISPRTLPSLS